MAASNACGRFLLAVRQSALSGTSHRGVPRPRLRLLVTGSIHYTIKIASAVSRRRRKSKIVHATRPDQIPPRPFHASTTASPLHSMGEGQGEGDTADPTVIPAQAGTHRKTKHAIYPLSRSEGGAGAQTTANRQRGMPPKPAPVPRYGGGNPPPPSLPIIKFSAISGSGNSRKYH